jgi:hypothetical protein
MCGNEAATTFAQDFINFVTTALKKSRRYTRD